jgi:hypothetical protein
LECSRWFKLTVSQLKITALITLCQVTPR